jgi:HSP20 family protein
MWTMGDLIPSRRSTGPMEDKPSRWDPLEAFHRDVDRLFEDFWRGGNVFRSEPLLESLSPRMDVFEDDAEFRVTAELPGLDEDDIEVVLGDKWLTIKGEKKAEKEESEKGYKYRERSYGSFHRMIPLEVEVVADKVDAKFEKGVLTVRLPKTPEAQRKVKKILVNPAKEAVKQAA